MICSKKRKLILIVAVLSILLFMFFNIKSNPSPKAERGSNSQITLVNQELEDFQVKLTGKDGLFDQVGKKLKKRGYAYNALGVIYSQDEILVEFVLANKEANKKESKEVITIFNETVVENKMDPKSFKVKVSNDDSPG